MLVHKQGRALPRRAALKAAVASKGIGAKPVTAFLRGLPMRKSVLTIAAVQTSIQSPNRGDPACAGAGNLESLLSLLDKVQTYGGHKDICLFPVVCLPGDALPSLVQAARRYNCIIVYGTESSSTKGKGRLTTTIAPTGEVRFEHAAMNDTSVLVLHTRHGTYRAVACAAEAWYPETSGITTAIHSPDGRAIVSTRSRGEQAVAAVLHIGPDRPESRLG